jgi:hypothetical protein
VKAGIEMLEPFSPHRIYNVGENGLSTVHVPQNILFPKYIKPLGSMISGK